MYSNSKVERFVRVHISQTYKASYGLYEPVTIIVPDVSIEFDASSGPNIWAKGPPDSLISYKKIDLSHPPDSIIFGSSLENFSPKIRF